MFLILYTFKNYLKLISDIEQMAIHFIVKNQFHFLSHESKTVFLITLYFLFRQPNVINSLCEKERFVCLELKYSLFPQNKFIHNKRKR